jgi:putative membrane protein
MEFDVNLMLSTVIYALLGIALFGVGFVVCAKLSPFSFRKEIEEDQNIALAVILGSMFLGLAIIIAASISG